MSEKDKDNEKSLEYQELLKVSSALANDLNNSTSEIIRLKTIISNLEFKQDVLKDCVSNLVALYSGECDVSDNDIIETLDYWKQAFETVGISIAGDGKDCRCEI